MIHPRSVRSLQFERAPVNSNIIQSIHIYLTVYLFILLASTLLISVDGYDFETTLSSIVTCLNNIGPGFNIAGPAGNFDGFSNFSKIILSFNMLAGRLEIFPMLMLFVPSLWKKRKSINQKHQMVQHVNKN
jgi:trk/ktr system potassium uptake protein